jgi:hypothetical protein
MVCAAILHFGGQRKGQTQPVPGNLPQAGVVPDATTAVRIAEAVLAPVYGEETIAKEKPFTATLKGDTWTVEGSMPKEARNGGVAVVQISKTRGCILSLVHYK